jgi:hypothetical protein
MLLGLSLILFLLLAHFVEDNCHVVECLIEKPCSQELRVATSQQSGPLSNSP